MLRPYTHGDPPQLDDVGADLDVELLEQQLAHGPAGDPGDGLAGAGALQDVARVLAVVLEDAREVGVARAGPRDLPVARAGRRGAPGGPPAGPRRGPAPGRSPRRGDPESPRPSSLPKHAGPPLGRARSSPPGRRALPDAC